MEPKPKRWSLVKPSTRAWLAEARKTPGFSFFDLLHGYVYGRWPYLYIGIGTGELRLARIIRPLIAVIARLLPAVHPQPEEEQLKFEDTYHGKVVPLEAAKQLVQVKRDISLPNLEPVIPYALARDIILHNPDHLIALECPCRAARPHPCLPLDVCLIVGEPFASFTIEHHPDKARWITPDEAVEILQAEDRRGHVHHAFFKDAMFGRFYAICNCCSCCCGAMQAQRGGTHMLAASGFRIQVEAGLCTGCGKCEKTCPFEAILVNGKAAVDETLCMGCGICVGQCVRGALSLNRDPARGEPLEIFKLMEEVISPACAPSGNTRG